MIKFTKESGGFYFLAKGRVGLSQIGHAGAVEIVPNEQKLTINIIVHLIQGKRVPATG
jgi:hypothetical protein